MYPELLKVKLLYSPAKAPSKGHVDDAGWDLYASSDVSIPSGQTVLVNTGIAISIPKGYAGLIWDRSSMGVKGIHRHAGVIDSGYTGEVKVCLNNTTKETYHVRTGDRVAQMLIHKIPDFNIYLVDDLDSSQREDGGFGSTGK
jgi:dUTP pyrophosphatase